MTVVWLNVFVLALPVLQIIIGLIMLRLRLRKLESLMGQTKGEDAKHKKGQDAKHKGAAISAEFMFTTKSNKSQEDEEKHEDASPSCETRDIMRSGERQPNGNPDVMILESSAADSPRASQLIVPRKVPMPARGDSPLQDGGNGAVAVPMAVVSPASPSLETSGRSASTVCSRVQLSLPSLIDQITALSLMFACVSADDCPHTYICSHFRSSVTFAQTYK